MVIFAISWAYCQLLLVYPGDVWPDGLRESMRYCAGACHRLVRAGLRCLGMNHPGVELQTGLYLVLTAGLFPLLASRLILRISLPDLGCRAPNRVGWRLLVLAYLVALPFVVFMGAGEGMAGYYLPSVQRAGLAAFAGFYAVNMLTEHFLFHGVLLGALRLDRRWPEAPVDAAPCPSGAWWRRALLYFGISNGHRDQGQSRITAWFQLHADCGAAMIGSALLFALIHIGKDWREAVLSFPGGVALAVIAYRSNSWLIPLLLHLLTAGTTLAVMMIAHR